MSLAAKLRPGLHRKWWDNLAPAPLVPINNSLLLGSAYGHAELEKHIYYLQLGPYGTTFTYPSVYRYDWTQDSWTMTALPISGVSPSSASAVFLSMGAPGGNTTVSAATSTLNTTSRFAVASLSIYSDAGRGCKVRCIAGTNAGFESTISSISPYASSQNIITLASAAPAAFDSTSKFIFWTGSIWLYYYGTSNNFLVFDCLTNIWTTKSATGISVNYTTAPPNIVATPSIEYGYYDSGTSSGSNTTTTLNDTTKAWLGVSPYQWINYQVRITAGTGVGQVRTISANTATQLTVSTAWTTTPDATSTYAIEANDDFLYLLGNSTTFFRYSISGNSWTTRTSAAVAPAVGSALAWMGYSSQPDWLTPDLTNISTFLKQNGRYIFMLSAGASSVAYYQYDIVGNAWSTVTYAVNGATNLILGSGSSNCSVDDTIYIQNSNTGNFYAFNMANREVTPLVYDPTPQSSTTTMSQARHFVMKHYENGELVKYLFTLHHGNTYFTRTLLI